ncbi:unannotated protein [freshwater metagenome]|uniref:Unannotated protein n=1 Tax=freshwater metagenome TaxID=449393 RepID=A0A6J6WPF2_9ZZZZ
MLLVVRAPVIVGGSCHPRREFSRRSALVLLVEERAPADRLLTHRLHVRGRRLRVVGRIYRHAVTVPGTEDGHTKAIPHIDPTGASVAPSITRVVGAT